MDIKFKDVVKGAVRSAGFTFVIGTTIYVGSKLGKVLIRLLIKPFPTIRNKKRGLKPSLFFFKLPNH